MKTQEHKLPADDSVSSLPDLCTPASVFLLVLVGLVVALVVALAAADALEQFWLGFGLTVLFVEWVVLVSAALICTFRRFSDRLPQSLVRGIVFLFIPGVTALMSVVVVQWSPLVDSGEVFWFVLRNMLISLLASLMLVRYLVLLQRWRGQVAAETRARLDALQASIRPHFLFNTLNTIASLVHDQPVAAEQATLDLSDLLRSGLRSGAEHSLGEELELVRGYLRLEGLRLGERLQVSWGLEEALPLDAQMPALLIQPLVENAIVHGIARRRIGGVLHIVLSWSRRGRLQVKISNPLAEPGSRPVESNRMALDNIRQRLALAYEGEAQLQVDQDQELFTVELSLPI